MPSNPNDWSVHAQSTRDLADRMLVRGDTKGAEAMLHAAMELEKRHDAATAIIPLRLFRGDTFISIDDSPSSFRPTVHFPATTINGQTRRAASDAPPSGNFDAWDPEMQLQPNRGVHDMPAPAFADPSPNQGSSVESLQSNVLADLQQVRTNPEPLYRSSLGLRFLLGWTANLYAHLHSVVEIVHQRARFVAIRPVSAHVLSGRPPEAAVTSMR